MEAPADARPAEDGAWALLARERLASADAQCAQRFDRGEPVDRLLAARASAVDGFLREAWQRCLPAGSAPALFAVGGYGRGGLYPQSDVDVLVLADDAGQAAHAEALARFFALAWDAGLAIGHAVRSPAQCTAAARDDLTVLTALMEFRPLQAGASACAALAAAIGPERAWPPRAFFEAKRQEQAQRHARFGDTSDNLEPNLKEGPGGLRDLQTLDWIALRCFGVPALEPLVELGHLGGDEAATLARERQVLERLRFGLHLVAGRREERLRFDHQKRLAERLGYDDSADSLGVETMMQGFYRAAAMVRRISERLLQRFEEHFDGAATPEPLDDDFEVRNGYLSARAPARLQRDPMLVLDLFAAWAAHPGLRGLHSQTARELALALSAIPAYPQVAPALRTRFMQLVRGPQAVRTLERMARLGVLGRWLPAFGRVTGRMQFDLFHAYTVDQHTLAVLRNIEGFASGNDERFAIAHDVWPRLPRPELLLLAGLFHDIAKGRGGDHSQLGAVDAQAFCAAHDLSASDTAKVEWLVEKHLLMSVTAQKQDIGDPEVIHRFATEVGDRERLDLLYLLTCADIAGTSPKLWNAWKDRLLGDLYTATRLALRRGLERPVVAAERIAENREAVSGLLEAQGVEAGMRTALLAQLPDEGFLRSRPDAVAWQAMQLRGVAAGTLHVAARPLGAQAGALEIFVRSPDRDGLFAAIVATLDRLGLAIQRARLLDAPDGCVVDTFEVVPGESARVVTPRDAEARLQSALATPDLDRVHPARRTQPRHLRHFRISPQVEFANAGHRTALTLVCNDRPGLLADASRVLRACRLRVHDARIATFGERAEDQFRISDEHDRPLDDDQRDSLRAALLAALDGEPR